MGLTEGEVCFEASAAASSSLLASLAAGQCGVGGRMLGSNFNSISLRGNQKKKTEISFGKNLLKHNESLTVRKNTP